MNIGANFILLDAARMEDNIDKALEFNKKGLSLFAGTKDKMLEVVSPYLFSYNNKSEMALWMDEKGWGNSWGVFILCYKEFDDLYKHFKKFILVKTEDGEEMYFRFYDPRVLRIFLPTCDSEQLKEFFGPVKAFLMEDENPEFAVVFMLSDSNELITNKISKENFTKVIAQGLEFIISPDQKAPSAKPEIKQDKPAGNKGRFSIID